MKVLFVADRRVDAGSIHAMANYSRVGNKLGHTMAVYGGADPRFGELHFSTDIAAFDHLVFVFESRLGWISGLHLARMLPAVPRERRAIIDADGMYNRCTVLAGYDRNHASAQDHSHWRAYYRELASRIFQPTLAPQEPDVEPLLFYGYAPEAQQVGSTEKTTDILHVAHNWWRWREVSTALLPAFEAVRPKLGRIVFLGAWWDRPPAWANDLGLTAAFAVDQERLRKLGVEVRPPVPYHDVVATMSQARINIMTQRPLLRHLRFVTSKYFEIFTANTIPLVMLDPALSELIYGPMGRRLVLHRQIGERLLDVLEHEDRYRGLADEVRDHLRVHHSYERRVMDLVEALERKS